MIMAKVGAQRAADLTGKSKSTIQRAMDKGKLSYEIDAHGRRLIDVSELERAFGVQQQKQTASSSIEQELEKASQMLEMERMKMRIKALEDQLYNAQEQIADLKEQRDRWQKQADQVLITSQYSQKQAEELRAEIKERERKAIERRQQKIDEQVKKLKPRNENVLSDDVPETEDDQAFNFQGLWKKVKNLKQA
jgi:chromosome segregation ATPase